MPKVTYVHPNGAREVLDVPLGTSVMRAAIVNGVDGIVAECGGEMMCATCHVYVEPDQLDRTPPQSDDEKAMLEFTASERKPNSRLSCQLVATAEFEGLGVYLPETRVCWRRRSSPLSAPAKPVSRLPPRCATPALPAASC